MLSTGSQDVERLVELTRQIGLRLESDIVAIGNGMNLAIESAIDELVDEETRPALQSSVANNVEVIVHMLANKKAANDLLPIPAAIRYAEELAQRNVSGSALRRAYHVGSDHLLAHIFDQVQEINCEPHEKLQLFHYLAGWTYQYVDEVTRVVMAAYEEKLRSSHERAARTVIFYVNRVLTDGDVEPGEFEAATGYRLDQVHIGCHIWIDDIGPSSDRAQLLSFLVDQLQKQLNVGQPPLLIMADRTSADVWFGSGSLDSPVETSKVAPVAEAVTGVRIAFGAPGSGPQGFCTTRAQAKQVATIARVSTSSISHVVSYADEGMPVIARLAEDVATTQRWVHEVLGGLAKDTAHAARQRDTIRIFLDSANSYSRTAARLMLHRNSIRYRLNRAEAELGRQLNENRLDTQLALALCHALGSAVLARGDS